MSVPDEGPRLDRQELAQVLCASAEREALIQRLRAAIGRVQPTAYVTILEGGLAAHAVIRPTVEEPR